MPVSIGYTTASIITLRAIETTELITGYLRFVIANRSWYSYDATSTAVADQNNIATPNSMVGRWFRISALVGQSDILDFAELVDDEVNSLIQSSSRISKLYSDSSNTLTLDLIAGSVTNTHIASNAGIEQSKILNLVNNLDSLTVAVNQRAIIGHTHTVSQITDFNEGLGDSLASMLIGGQNVTITYDDVVGTITIEVTGTGGGGGGGSFGDWDSIGLSAWDASY